MDDRDTKLLVELYDGFKWSDKERDQFDRAEGARKAGVSKGDDRNRTQFLKWVPVKTSRNNYVYANTEDGKFEVMDGPTGKRNLFYKESGGDVKHIGTFRSTDEAINKAEQSGKNPA